MVKKPISRYCPFKLPPLAKRITTVGVPKASEAALKRMVRR
jgi:hypothetical protein